MTRAVTLAAVLVLALAVLATGCGSSSDGDSAPQASTTSIPVDLDARVKAYVVPSRNHVAGPVDYPQKPPVGGDHAPVWQNCGFYSQPVSTERAVHAMEHGAVWITHRPDLPKSQVDILRALARSTPYVLVSPWSDGTLPAPVVASAWGVQLTADSATDPAIAAFVERYAGGPQTPEPGAPCSGGVGNPG